MISFTIKKELFNLNYIPAFAGYILNTSLKEYVLVGIRFAREAELPLLKPLSKYNEEELVNLRLESDKRLLEALINNRVADHIEQNVSKWINNTLGTIDQKDIVAEDITLLLYVRRKTLAHFLDAYTKNLVLQKLILAELDSYTTQEELITYNVYLKMQKQQLELMNEDLTFHKELLLEGQELSGMGSFQINFHDPSKNIFTPEYQRIFEMESTITFEEFLSYVHPEDLPALQATIRKSYTQGGKFETEYRFKKTEEKRIWSKGFILTSNNTPLFIRGIVKEVPVNQAGSS